MARPILRLKFASIIAEAKGYFAIIILAVILITFWVVPFIR